MSRLCRLGLLVVCVAGVGSPAPSEAQIFPWLYDSTYGTGYVPYSAGYAPYSAGYSSYYGAPYSASYAPYSTGYRYSPGCNNCQSASYSYCGCSPCAGACATGCASGNCATGNCSTTTNSAPLAPIPDPVTSTRSIENRLEVIERHLHIKPPKTTPERNNGNQTYSDDDFNARPSRGSSGSETDTTVPSRNRRGTGNDGFEAPVPAEDGLFQENPDTSKKIPLPAELRTEGSVIPSKKPAAAAPVDESGPKPGTVEDKAASLILKLDGQLTSHAVSPRERLSIPVGFAKPTAVASKKPASKSQVDARPQSVNVARH